MSKSNLYIHLDTPMRNTEYVITFPLDKETAEGKGPGKVDVGKSKTALTICSVTSGSGLRRA